MNSNFKRYIKSHKFGSSEEQERIKNDLHRFFATLSSEQQVYANMVINDLENGKLLIEEDKDFMDYVNDYRERSENREIAKIVNALGVDENTLREMLALNITKININEFGRFDKLRSTVDKKQAKNYMENQLNETMKPYEVSMKTDNLLRDFLLSDGFDIDEYLTTEE